MKVSYINAKDSTTPMVILAVSQEKVFFFPLLFAATNLSSGGGVRGLELTSLHLIRWQIVQV